MDDPYEIIEGIAEANSYGLIKNETGLTLVVPGKLGNYIFNFFWYEREKVLHMFCAFPLEVSESNLEHLRMLAARINEHLIIGHFTVDVDGRLASYRHAHVLPAEDELSPDQCGAMITYGLHFSDKYRPAFEMVGTGADVEQTLKLMLEDRETLGRA